MAMSALCAMARDAREAFASEPGCLMPTVSRTLRLDLLDYYDAGQAVKRNSTTGKDNVQLVSASSRLVSINYANGVSAQIMTMPVSKSDTLIIAAITVENPARDSQLVTFKNNWEPVAEGKVIKLPSVEQFFKKEVTKKDRAEAMKAVLFPVIYYTFDESDGSIVAHLNIEKVVDPEQWKRIAPLFNTELRYVPSGSKFRLAK